MNRLKKYLLLTFIISWGSWGILALLTRTGILTFSSVPGMILYIVGGFGPTIASIALLENGHSVKNIVNYIFTHKHGTWVWLLLICVLELATMGLASRELNADVPIFAVPFVFLICTLAGGGNEELGWRGLMQPSMEHIFPFPAATLITGAVWSVWHLPLWLIEGTGQFGTSFPMFAAFAIILSFWLACVYKMTGCVFACCVLHGLSNTVMSVFVLKVNWIMIVGLIITTAVSIILWYKAPEKSRADA